MTSVESLERLCLVLVLDSNVNYSVLDSVSSLNDLRTWHSDLDSEDSDLFMDSVDQDSVLVLDSKGGGLRSLIVTCLAFNNDMANSHE